MSQLKSSIVQRLRANSVLAAGRIVDAVADALKEAHDAAVLRLAMAGAVPNNTVAMVAEWFQDWALPIEDEWRNVVVPCYEELAALKRAPEFVKPHGLMIAEDS